MGKETKIGLAVIGVLLIAFGALVFRRLNVPHDRGGDSPRGAEAAAAGSAADAPAVVLAQSVSPAGQDPASDASGAAPAGSFLPAEQGIPGLPPADRYATAVPDSAPLPERLPAEGSEPVAQSGNPFRSAPPKGLSPSEAREPAPVQRLTTDADRAIRRGNPLRRLSAQEPLEVADEQESGRELPAAESASEPVGDRAALPALETADDEPLAPGERPDDELAPPAARTAADDDRYAPVERAAVAEEAAPAGRATPRREPTAVGDARVDALGGPDVAPASGADDGWSAQATPRSAQQDITPAAVQDGKYVVQPNDNLWVISEKVYGTGGYFKALYEHNRARLPRSDRLTVGAVVEVPPAAALEQSYPALCPKPRKSALVNSRTVQASTRGRAVRGADVYVVEDGDTLFDIARYELGRAGRWSEIYELNRELLGEDFDYLKPGTELRMPPRSQPADSFTRQGEPLQR